MASIPAGWPSGDFGSPFQATNGSGREGIMHGLFDHGLNTERCHPRGTSASSAAPRPSTSVQRLSMPHTDTVDPCFLLLHPLRRSSRKTAPSLMAHSIMRDSAHVRRHCCSQPHSRATDPTRPSRPRHHRKARRAVVFPGDWNPSPYLHPTRWAHDSPRRQIGPLHEQQRKDRKRAPAGSRNTERRRLTIFVARLCNNREESDRADSSVERRSCRESGMELPRFSGQ